MAWLPIWTETSVCRFRAPIAELEVYGKDGTAIDEITVSRVLVAPNPVNQGQKMAVAADQAERGCLKIKFEMASFVSAKKSGKP